MPERGLRCLLAPRRLDASLGAALPGALLDAVFYPGRTGPIALLHDMTLEMSGVEWAIKKHGKTLAVGDDLLGLLAVAYATTEGTIAALALSRLFGVAFDARTSHRLARVIDTWAKMGRPVDRAAIAAAAAEQTAPSLSPTMSDLLNQFASLILPRRPAPAEEEVGG